MSPERNWKMRVEDILAHEYFGLSLSIIWRTIGRDLPPLSRELVKMLQQER